jgi:hypothetical protein
MLNSRAALVAVLCAAGLLGFVLLGNQRNGSFDFQAFYCAGAAARVHADPYRTQPLKTCEHRATDNSHAALPASVALPAPQPGYDIAVFSALAALPFDRAKSVWGALLAIAIALTVLATLRVSGERLQIVPLAFVASLMFPALALGELFALFAGAASCAMLFAHRSRWRAAGAAAALSLVEPHLGLPLCAALFVCRKQTRLAMTLTVALLAVLSVLAIGVQRNLEYFIAVLPLHALSEIASDSQLSVSAVLHVLGLTDHDAILGGLALYVVAAIAGIVLGRALAQRTGDGAFLVAVPAAAAIAGGTFVHVTEYFAAIPLVLLLLSRASRYRAVLIASLALLAIPWYMALERGIVLAFALLGTMVLYMLLREYGIRVALTIPAITLTFAMLFFGPKLAAIPGIHVPAPSRITDTTYPQASWQAWNLRVIATGNAFTWVFRFLSWSGLILLGTGAVLLLRDPNGLRVDELVQPELGELASVPASLHAAKR